MHFEGPRLDRVQGRGEVQKLVPEAHKISSAHRLVLSLKTQVIRLLDRMTSTSDALRVKSCQENTDL